MQATNLAEQKELRTFRRGRVSSRSEIRRQLLFRTNYEKLLFSRLATLFRIHINTIAQNFEEGGFFDISVSSRELYQTMSPLMLSFLRRVVINTYRYNEEEYSGGRKAEEAFVFGRHVDVDALVNSYYRGRELVLAGIPANISKKIDKIIMDGRGESLTLAKISSNIRKYVIPLSRSRAALIARTETHGASSFANHSYHDQVRTNLGMNMYKEWVATGDGRTRTTHAEANGQRVHMDDKFQVGGSNMSYSGDPAGGAKNVINCRCVIIYVDERDIVLP